MSSKGALVVIGSGPGIGRSTAAYFVEQGFRSIILLSRDQARLAEDAKVVTSAASGTNVETLTIDVAADEATIKEVLVNVDGKLKAADVPLEVILYNAARVAPSKIMDWPAKGLEDDLRITTVSLYVVLQWAIPQLLDTAKSGSYNPAFLTTSGGLFREPVHFLFSLSAGKAAQHNLMNSFHQKYEPQIHVACVPINGVVNDSAKVTTPKAVAAEFWKLYEQKKGTKGQLSVEMDDPDYLQMVDGMGKQVDPE